MELTFHGHACISLRGESGVVVMDPYKSGSLGGAIGFSPVEVEADWVTISHYHVDHAHVTPALGKPTVVDQSGVFKGIDFQCRATYHDRFHGTRMGLTTMTAFEFDGLRIAHLGDIGCDLTAADVEAIGPVDILVFPTGGTYTLGAADAPMVLEALKPRLAIPVHYECEGCRLGLEPVEALESHLSGLHRPIQSRWTSADGMPSEPSVLVLEPAN
jgi:L-ascorbate metabolism protein UlaG (beta-lactamase superfamily)